MTTEAWIGVAVQIPVVGIFVWFVLELLKRQSASNEKRDSEWRVFLEQQTGQSNAAIARIAEEVKRNTENLSTISGILISHDTSTQLGLANAREKLVLAEELSRRLERIRLERDYYRDFARANNAPPYPGERDSWHGDISK